MSYNQYDAGYKAQRKRKHCKRIRSRCKLLRELHKQNQRDAARWDNGTTISEILGREPEGETEPDWQEELESFLKELDSTLNTPKEEA